MSLNVTVNDVIKETVYKDQVYEYRVILDYNGVEFGVFDKDMLCSPEYVTSSFHVEIAPFLLTELTKVEDSTLGIIPNKDAPHDWKHHTYIGKILSIYQRDLRRATLDLGDGTVDITLDENEIGEIANSVEQGDVVRFTSIRTDLHRIRRK